MPCARYLMSTAAALLVAACASGVPKSLPALNVVPPEIAAKSNPFTLSDKDVRYYTRQFKAKCARCHGLNGDGGGEEARAQPIPPRDLSDAAYMNARSDGQLFYQIQMGGGPGSPMPAFGATSDQAWSDEKVWKMVAFVRRFSQEH